MLVLHRLWSRGGGGRKSEHFHCSSALMAMMTTTMLLCYDPKAENNGVSTGGTQRCKRRFLSNDSQLIKLHIRRSIQSYSAVVLSQWRCELYQGRICCQSSAHGSPPATCFSIALDSATHHSTSYLDWRFRIFLPPFYDIVNLHAAALPMFDRHTTGEVMHGMVAAFLTVVCGRSSNSSNTKFGLKRIETHITVL